MNFEIPTSIIKPLMRTAAKQSSRISIECIHFSREVDKCKAESTDSRSLLICTWTDENKTDDFNLLIPAKQLKPVSGWGEIRIQKDSEDKLSFHSSLSSYMTVPIIEEKGNFPNTDDVISRIKEMNHEGKSEFNGKELEILLKSINECTKSNVFIFLGDKHIMIKSSNDSVSIVGVRMGMS